MLRLCRVQHWRKRRKRRSSDDCTEQSDDEYDAFRWWPNTVFLRKRTGDEMMGEKRMIGDKWFGGRKQLKVVFEWPFQVVTINCRKQSMDFVCVVGSLSSWKRTIKVMIRVGKACVEKKSEKDILETKQEEKRRNANKIEKSERDWRFDDRRREMSMFGSWPWGQWSFTLACNPQSIHWLIGLTWP